MITTASDPLETLHNSSTPYAEEAAKSSEELADLIWMKTREYGIIIGQMRGRVELYEYLVSKGVLTLEQRSDVLAWIRKRDDETTVR